MGNNITVIISKFITNKLQLSKDREPLLNVSPITYSLLQGASLYTDRHIQHQHVALLIVSRTIHDANIPP